MSKSLKSRKIHNPILVALLTATLSTGALAQSPPNITADIKWTYNGGLDINGTSPPPATYGSVAIIEAAFNNARRQEEIQLNLANGTIADLDLPTQTDWDAMSDDQKALYILNAERTSRAGMQAGVIGLPFAGVESAIDMIADAYVDVLINNDATGHNQPSGNEAIDGIFAKIDNSATLANCHSNIPRGENIAWYGVSAGSSIPLPVERAIYQWIYDDSSSNWGHREMALLQDQPLDNSSGLAGFTNDNGDAAHEGYIGFSSKGSSDYDPFTTPTAYSQAVVMQFFDPTPVGGTNNCAFVVTQTTETLPAAGANTTTTPTTATPGTTTPATTNSGGSGGGSFGFSLLAGLFGLFVGLRRRISKS